MDIVGIGTPCMDMISVINELPKPNKGSGVLDYSRQGGGLVATAMVAASRLGAEVSFVGVVGSCVHGRAIQDDFIYNGVDISRCVLDENESSPFAFILSDLQTGGRSILYRRGTERSLTVDDLDKDFITGAAYLHLENCDKPDATAAKWMRAASKKVAYDASEYSEKLEAFMPNIDIFIASEHYYNTCFKEGEPYDNCRAVAEKGPEIVVFTLGDKGCVGFSKLEGYFEAAAYKVPVVDTVGAGDVFHGAFLYGLLQGMKAAETALFANAVSAIKVGAIGGRAGIPSYDTAKKFMETGKIDMDEISQRIRYYREKWLFG